MTRLLLVACAALLWHPGLAKGQVSDPAQPAPDSADLLSRQALEAYYDGRHEDAARLYHAAFARDPARPQFLYGAARAEHRAGRWNAAARDYRRVIVLAGAGSPLGVKAQHHLSRLPADRKAASTVAATAKMQGPTALPRTSVGRWTLAGGGVLTLAAVALGGWAWADQASLDEQTAKTTGGRVSGLRFQAASAQQASINQRLIAAQALGGAALVTAGVGAWLLWSDAPERGTSAVVVPGGAALRVRF